MILQNLHILNYRNIEEANILFSPNVNCLVGANGMGKSNVLDAIHYLSFCRGFVTQSDADNVRHGADAFLLSGEYTLDDETPQRVSCGWQGRGRKRLKVDGNDVRRLADHIGRLPIVMITPYDAALVGGGSEERRRFMDEAIAQCSPAYLQALMRYEKALKQRGAMLKQETPIDEGLISVIEEMMASAAKDIYAARAAFVEDFRPIFAEQYARLVGEDVEERPDVAYISHAERGDLAVILREWREREHLIGHTLHGPHRDDLALTLGGYALRREGSQGQTKTFFIALRIAQYLYLRSHGERRTPILLLDDIFDKLDARRVGHIINYVSSDAFGQIFITDTERGHLDKVLAATRRDYRLFHVESGLIQPLNTTKS